MKLRDKAINKSKEPLIDGKKSESLVFPVHYFDGVNDLKSVVRSLDNELKEIIGDVHISRRKSPTRQQLSTPFRACFT